MDASRVGQEQINLPLTLSHRAVLIRSVIVLVLLVMAVLVYVVPAAQGRGNELTVTFFDIGQGDAIFIESPTGVQMLIDGGPPDGGVLRRLSARMGFFDRSIDYVLSTHPDKDHVGGLPDVLDRYTVSAVLMTENTGASAADRMFIERTKTEGAQVTYVRRGMHYDLGGGVVLTILFPDHDPTLFESNTSSIVARLTYGDSEFLFTGDSPQAIEQYLVSLDGTKLASDVLKAGHHGSRTSSSATFVEAVHPAYAVVSAGKNNQYGHPHKEVLDLFQRLGIITKNTADLSSISFVSDGRSVSLK